MNELSREAGAGAGVRDGVARRLLRPARRLDSPFICATMRRRRLLIWLPALVGTAACELDYSADLARDEALATGEPSAAVSSAALAPVCHDDYDCTGDEKCAPDDGLTSGSSLLAAVPEPPPPSPPCDEADCEAGQVCQEWGSPRGCQARCDQGYECAEYAACADSGHCIIVYCDDERHPGCPEGMACDPQLRIELDIVGGYRPYGTEEEHGEAGPPSAAITLNERFSGCIFLRCDQDGARPCADGFYCDTDAAHEQTTGCVPIPCDELGRCSSVDLICRAESSGPGIDAHGCVRPNCAEGGVTCRRGEACVPDRPGADSNGCAPARCDDGLVCDPKLYRGCDPALAAGAGCIPKRCDEDMWCDRMKLCHPDHPTADPFGCVDRSELTERDVDAALGESDCQSRIDCVQSSCVLGECSAFQGRCVPR